MKKEEQKYKKPTIEKDNSIFSSPNENFKMLIERLDKDLEEIPHKPFSNPAFIRLKKFISQYIAELISESIKNANREKLDSVSATHVEKASNYLISSTRGKVNKLFSSTGGVLLGATLSNIVNMILKGGETSITGIVITVILGIVGAFLLAYNR